MAKKNYDQQLKGFREAAQSLKLYRRADLNDINNGDNLIEKLYVDALPEEHILQTVMRGNTTFIIGRKGTGKSTIFQRSQFEIRKLKDAVSAYVDIKTIYESSQVDPLLLNKIDEAGSGLPAAKLQELLLHKAFLKDVVEEIKKQLKDRIRISFWNRLKSHFSSSLDALFQDLDNLLDEANKIDLTNVSGLISKNNKDTKNKKESNELNFELNGELSSEPKINIGLKNNKKNENEENNEAEFTNLFIRIFNIKELINKLRALLHGFGIKTLYIFVDDFSELPQSAMQVVVNTLLAPLNNWSDELIKFKVAAYPGRIYYGQIDKTKIDEIYLDLFKLYGIDDVAGMETKAIDFTRRLVIKRLEYYCGSESELVKTLDNGEVWQHLFYAAMGNPRNLGYMLYFLYEANLIFGKKIGVRAIQEAARKYYEDKIEPYFAMSRFLHESFEERSSIFSLQELLEETIDKARNLRSFDSSVISSIQGRAPTSHFYVASGLEGLLSTLELNFFLTKYYEMRDRDGKEVTVFALNYGLCQKHSISFGRPQGRREYRLYYVERIFDYSALLRAFLEVHQEIVCDECQTKHKLEILPAIRAFGMLCPVCRKGTCQVVNLSRKYEKVLREIDDSLLLPKYELGILQTLRLEDRPMVAAEIAEELDCSGQLIGWRARNLGDRGLVERRKEEDSPTRVYELTELARAAYFGDSRIYEVEKGHD